MKRVPHEKPPGFDSRPTGAGLHGFAMVCVTMTLVLIFIGGLVTSTGSAMAVPDWPLAFGHLVPKLVGGVRFEYGHRVAAGIVVILTLVMAVWAWMSEERRWVRNIAFAAVALVVVQAVLGGITVLLVLPLPVAVAHAATAQAFFCLMVAFATFTNPRWNSTTGQLRDERWPALPLLAVITTGVIYLQILIGAVMRHMGAGLAIPDFPLSYGQSIPPEFTAPIAVNYAHRCGALAVSIFVIWTAARVFIHYRDKKILLRPALCLVVLLFLQISLGALTIWSGRAVIPTTAHVAVGASVLAASFALTLRAAHIFGGLRHVAEPAWTPDMRRGGAAMEGR